MFEFETTRMGESLIDLVRQYPALWDKQNSKYKDSNYKDAKWREIAEALGVPKDDAIKKYMIHISGRKISKQKVVMA